MSWRVGLGLLEDLFRTIDQHQLEKSDRLALKADVMQVFLTWDVDPCGLDEDPQFADPFRICEQREKYRQM